jgi:hypothetical protein
MRNLEHGSLEIMNRRARFATAAGIVVLLLAGVFAYRHWHSSGFSGTRDEILSLMPNDPTSVVFLDLVQFRSSNFLPQLLSWAPGFPAEEDYVKFVQATGFNYERDLDRVALAFTRQGNSSTVFAVADGRFDRKKIEAYAAQSGERINNQNAKNNHIVFALNLKNSTHKSFFTFLRDDRIAWTDDPAYAALFQQAYSFVGKKDWKEHFARLGGTAVFAVIRQDEATTEMLAQQAPGGFRSPQLASLVSQLQWITIGGKPEGEDLRVVMEGQSATESTIHQLKDFLGGILLLAQVGLNGPKNRKEMDPQLREAYLNLLKTAEVENVDRGTEKSVRVILQITPSFLEAVKKASMTGAANGH